jgi:hypothetical protein
MSAVACGEVLVMAAMALEPRVPQDSPKEVNPRNEATAGAGMGASELARKSEGCFTLHYINGRTESFDVSDVTADGNVGLLIAQRTGEDIKISWSEMIPLDKSLLMGVFFPEPLGERMPVSGAKNKLAANYPLGPGEAVEPIVGFVGFAESLALFVEGRDALVTILEREEDLENRILFEKWAARLEKAANECEVIQRIRKVKSGSLASAREQFEKFLVDFPTSARCDVVHGELKKIDQMIAEKASSFIRTNFNRYLSEKVLGKAVESGIRLQEAIDLAENNAFSQTIASLCETLNADGVPLTHEMATQLWENRGTKLSRSSASFGTGTFIVDSDKIKSTMGISLDPDRWWSSASEEDKTEFLRAYFAVKSGTVSQSAGQERVCRQCQGQRQFIFRDPTTGREVAKNCDTCKTIGYERTVFFK